MARNDRRPRRKKSGKPKLTTAQRLKESLKRERAVARALKESAAALKREQGARSEALEAQTATSEILRVISSSPTDVQPVFDTIVRSAGRLCGAESAAVYRFEGEMAYFVAGYHFNPKTVEAYRRDFPRPLRETDHLQRLVNGSVLNIADIQNDPHTSRRVRDAYRSRDARSAVLVPMVREGRTIGAIGVSHHDLAAFSDERIDLLKTFADQAVIAIENVRLFKELEGKNRALTEAHAQVTEALERQTATSEILRVISRSQTDVQPVFDTIVRSAVRLCGGLYSALFQFDGELIHQVAQHNFTPEALEASHRLFPARPTRARLTGRAILERAVVHIPDIEVEPEYQYLSLSRAVGFRSGLCVPMLREGAPIGVIGVARAEPGPFSDSQIELLKTFADQAVIAIENVRLFNELADKSRQLEAASQHKSEFLANMSHDLRTPLNAIIGFSEVLAEGMFGEVNEKQTEYLRDILESGRHLLSLINDILDLSKIEAGRMELELAVFDLPQALEDALILVRERATRRGIALHKAVDPKLGAMQADERKVKQVVLNLLSNALKFTPEGGRIEVRAVPTDGAVEVSVQDTGIGIAPEDQEAVFEEFRQVGGADKKAEGTGLGLALCRKFVELHGGRIWVRSQVGAGSTFTFTLPVSRGE